MKMLNRVLIVGLNGKILVSRVLYVMRHLRNTQYQIASYKYVECVCVSMAIKPKTKCPECESGQVYVRISGTIVCRLCGTISQPTDQT